MWSERRTVKKTATVSLHGNLYQVDPCLVRCTVELIFDPFDLTGIDVRHKGKPAGKAVPFLIGRHRHAKTRDADGDQRAEPEPTGIDYLRILDTAHGPGPADADQLRRPHGRHGYDSMGPSAGRRRPATGQGDGRG